MTPTAFQLGEGADLRAPLAATVLGGVISSTALTLVVVPVVYTLLDGLTTRFARLRHLRLTLHRLRPSRSSAGSPDLDHGIVDGHVTPNGVQDDREAASPNTRTRGGEL